MSHEQYIYISVLVSLFHVPTHAFPTARPQVTKGNTETQLEGRVFVCVSMTSMNLMCSSGERPRPPLESGPTRVAATSMGFFN